MNAVAEVVAATPVRLDIGCGPNKRPGFIGIDCISFTGVDLCLNAGADRLPFDDGTVEEVNCSHFLEHLEARERMHFMNEIYRVMKVGAKALIVVPHWASNRAYGDMTHKWPPVSEMFFFYLDKGWRLANAPHNDASNMPGGYDCDFLANWGYSLHPSLITRNQDYQQFAMQNYKEACQDTICTLTKR